MAVVEAALRSASEVVGDVGRIVADHHVVAERVSSAARELLVQLDRAARDARVVNAGEPPAVRFLHGGEDRRPLLLSARRRDHASHESLGAIDQHAGRLAVGAAQDAAAIGIRRVLRQVRGAERGGVDEGGVSIHARDVHGMVRHGARERFVRGEARVAPIVLVPSASEDPRARRHLARARGDARDHLVVRLRTDEIDRAERGAEPGQVRVRVHHAGDDGVAAEVEHARAGAAERERAAVRADEEDAAAADGHRVAERMRRVHRVDASVRDDELGRSDARGLLCVRGSGRECRRHQGTGEKSCET